MRIVLHIGTDKTGSSSIQQHLAANHYWFLDRGIYVPRGKTHVAKGHSNLLERNIRPFWGLHMHLGNAYLLGSSTFLVSWEGMSFYTAEKIRELAGHLGDNDIEILVYVREQADILQSGFLQQIKSFDNTIPLRNLIKPLALWDEGLREWLTSGTRDYYRLLQTWRAEFPRAQFRIRIYEKSKLVHGNVVDDLMDQLGETMDKSFHRIEEFANPSLDVESALLVEKWKEQGLAADRLRHCTDVVQSLAALEGGATKYFLDSEAVAVVREGFRPSNQQFAQEFLTAKDATFSLENRCYRDVSLEELEQRAALLERQVSRCDAYPSLRPTKKDVSIPDQLTLTEGWQARDDNGVRSTGTESYIRFRIFATRLHHAASGIRILLCGNYHDGRHRTAIEINGRDYGTFDLQRNCSGFELPFDELGICDTVDIVLRHASEGQGDRQGIFELRNFKYALIPKLVAASN